MNKWNDSNISFIKGNKGETMKLELVQKSNLEYVLIHPLWGEKGIITANDSCKDYIQIDRFWVDIKYRSTAEKPSKYKYGTQLLRAIINDAKSNERISRIIVVPKAEELSEGVKEMDINELYAIYEHLGFEFMLCDDSRYYERKMELRI